MGCCNSTPTKHPAAPADRSVPPPTPRRAWVGSDDKQEPAHQQPGARRRKQGQSVKPTTSTRKRLANILRQRNKVAPLSRPKQQPRRPGVVSGREANHESRIDLTNAPASSPTYSRFTRQCTSEAVPAMQPSGPGVVVVREANPESRIDLTNIPASSPAYSRFTRQCTSAAVPLMQHGSTAEVSSALTPAVLSLEARP